MATGDQQFTSHDGGPPPYRPLSAGAVTSLVLALLFALFAAGGLWWLMVLPLVVVALSWPGVAAGRRRGKPLLMISLFLSLGVGAYSYWSHRHDVEEYDRELTPLVAALEADDRTKLERWVLESVEKPAVFDAWKTRLEAARKDAGPWSGHLRLRQGWLGVTLQLVFAPGDVVEVEPVGSRPIEPGKAIWLCAPHMREDVWFALEVGESGKEAEGLIAFGEWLEARRRGVGGPSDGGAGASRFLRDVRVFRASK